MFLNASRGQTWRSLREFSKFGFDEIDQKAYPIAEKRQAVTTIEQCQNATKVARRLVDPIECC
jgi:hypothetical protein